MIEQNLQSFLEVLASSAPVPGGGGASAMVAAMGTALGAMVANLTVGKKKYADVQEDIQVLIQKSEKLMQELEQLLEQDAIAFEPLSKAYSLPKTTPEELQYRNQVMESALLEASLVPIEIMEKTLEAMILLEELAEKGTKIAISDVGVGIQFCKSALQGASLNVFINTKLMKDRAQADRLNDKTDGLIERGSKLADSVFARVISKIRE